MTAAKARHSFALRTRGRNCRLLRLHQSLFATVNFAAVVGGIRRERRRSFDHHHRQHSGCGAYCAFTGAVADVLGRKRVIVVAMFVLVIPTVMVGPFDQPVGDHFLARGTGPGSAADLRGDRGRLYRR